MREEDGRDKMTKEEILNYFSDLNVVYNNPNKLDDLRKMLDKLTEQKTGRWENIHAELVYKGDGWIGFTCENCKCQHALSSGEYGWYYGKEIPWKYCPNCGAKMEVEDE